MTTIINTLVPLLILLAAGNIMRRTGFLSEGFWASAEQMTYYILMPLLLVRVIGSAELGDIPITPMVTTTYTAIIATAILSYFGYAVLRNRVGAPMFTSIFQGAVRYNTYIALALVEGLFGAQGVVMGGLMAGFNIVLINIFCVATLSMMLGGGKFKLLSVLKNLAVNPLVLGCVGGGLINIADIPVPVWADNALALIGRMALPIALLCAGSALQVRRLKGDLTPALVSGLLTLIIKPTIGASVALMFDLDAVSLTVLLMFLAVPTAPAAYILAKKMGGDHEAMATIIAFQTLAGFATLPVVMLLLGVS